MKRTPRGSYLKGMKTKQKMLTTPPPGNEGATGCRSRQEQEAGDTDEATGAVDPGGLSGCVRNPMVIRSSWALSNER